MTTGTDSQAGRRDRALLIEMLASIRHTSATPLHFGIDACRAATAALRKVGLADAHEPLLVASIDRIARDALECPSRVTESDEDAGHATLAAWLEERHRRLSSIHPLAMDVLGLLVEGESHRDVADRLDLGLRLIRRIVRDARTTWMEGSRPCCSR